MAPVLILINLPKEENDRDKPKNTSEEDCSNNQTESVENDQSLEQIADAPATDENQPTTNQIEETVNNTNSTEKGQVAAVERNKDDDKTKNVKEEQQPEETSDSSIPKEQKSVNVETQEKSIKPMKKSTIQMKRAMSFYDMSKVCKNILKTFKVKKATWLQTDNGEFWQVMFQLDSKFVDDILNRLLQAGIGNNEYTSVSVVPITVNFPSMMPESEDILQASDDNNEAEKSEFLQSIKSRLTVAQVISSVRAGSQLSFDYIMLLILASMIAAIGLFESSSVLLVASMLVSPLMGPILGGTFGLVLQYKPVWKPAILNELLGLSVCLIMGFVFGIICGNIPGWDVVTSEMIGRGEYRGLLVGFLIAVPSGAAVALSILGGNVGSLVGVAISASLLPPAVNAGIFWAFAIICGVKGPSPMAMNVTISDIPKPNLRLFEPRELAKLGGISVTLTIINIMVIFIMGVLILKLKEVAPKTGTAVTREFWKVDLKNTRSILHRHKDAHEEVEEEVIEEWSRINKIDLKNKETLYGEKGAKVARELKGFLDKIESENKELVDRLGNKPGNRMLNHMKERLVPEKKSSRFKIAPVTYETVPLETTFVSRFTKTKLDVVDQTMKPSASTNNISILSSTETHKRSGSRPSVPSTMPGTSNVQIDMGESDVVRTDAPDQPLLNDKDMTEV